jgi:hypothetical protein
MGGVEESFPKCYNFFKYGKLVLQVFESIKFQGESVWKRVLRVVEHFNFEV